MKIKVTVERGEIVKILNEGVSKAVGQPMVARNEYSITDDIEFEPEDILAERKAARTRLVTPADEAVEDRPRLSTEGSAAAQEVEEELSL